MDTLNTRLQDGIARYGARIALRYKKDRVYHDISYADLGARVDAVASGLAALGIGAGDRVAILSENRPEWAIADLAALSLGAAVIPIYPTLPAPQVAYILRDSGARILFVSDSKQLKKAREVKRDVAELARIVVMDTLPAAAAADAATDETVMAFAALQESGSAQPLSDLAARRAAARPEDVASIVYTSGTTGDPKGAMLTHGNFVANVDSSIKHYAAGGEAICDSDVFFSFLPVCHAYERTTGYYLPLTVGAAIGYSDGIRTLVEDMALLQPTLMVCVPRVYEAMQERIADTVAKQPEKRQKLFQRAIAVATACVERLQAGKTVGPLLALQRFVFEKLVYSKLRARFGGNFRFFVSGGAALSADTARFFAAIGIPISEGYGMTEASPVMSTNPLNRTKIGTVGTVLPGGAWKIAGDGEVLYRGPNVMKGYWNNPAATAEVIDGDGWLHTGDVGVIDAEGYLKITDRKKDILVLANGKNVAPQPIEAKLKQSPFLSEVVLLGDKQSTVSALVLPNKSKLTEWAKEQGLTWDGDDALLALPEVKRKVKQEIDSRSKDLADFERVKKFALLNAVFSVDTGEMTPTLKIKRKVVVQKYAREIAALRGGGGGADEEGGGSAS